MPRASKCPRSRRPRWHWIITIKWDESNRFPEMVTASGTCVPPPGYTRQDMFDLLYERTVRQAKATDAYVLFFSLEPDELCRTDGAGP